MVNINKSQTAASTTAGHFIAACIVCNSCHSLLAQFYPHFLPTGPFNCVSVSVTY